MLDRDSSFLQRGSCHQSIPWHCAGHRDSAWTVQPCPAGEDAKQLILKQISESVFSYSNEEVAGLREWA